MGNARFQLNKDANSINEFTLPDCDFSKEIIRESYVRSQCYHLDSPININFTLDTLGEHALKLNGDLIADLLDIEFLEEIAWHICERFNNHIDMPRSRYDESNSNNKTKVINLPNAKIRRANARQ